MDDIEKRLAALEAKVEERAARRRKFVPEEEKEAAEIAAAIEYYQRTGRAPEGFTIEDPGRSIVQWPLPPPEGNPATPHPTQGGKYSTYPEAKYLSPGLP